jgi:hypothetical protein
MATKAKAGLSGTIRKEPTPKTTSQGQGTRSRPRRRGHKPWRGQGVGIPIGASSSQIMANMALNPVDHFARRELKLGTYLRYCDDMIALFETAADAHAAYKAMDAKVQEVGLALNSKSSVGWIADGVDWVGYRHWANYKLIRKRAMKRLKRKAKGGCSLETTMAYLSHAKQTASLRHVARVLWQANSSQRPEIYSWVKIHGDNRIIAACANGL